MDDKFLKIAKQAALEAGKIISKYFGKNHKYKFKGEDSSNFATEADLEAEKVILKILQQNFPDHKIISEEEGEIGGDSEYIWTIDPLDGTITFSTGLPDFCVCIGLLKNHQPILGIIYHPQSKDLYWAQKNKGAFVNGKKITVNKVNSLEKAVAGVDFGHRATRVGKIKKYVLPLIEKVSYCYSSGSDAYILTLVSNGILSCFVNQDNVWDSMPGALIVTEAGGKFTDLSGGEIDWSKKRIEFITSNGLIHDAIVEALR